MLKSLIIHTTNENSLIEFFKNFNLLFHKKEFTINLNSENYLPWQNKGILNEIITFRTYNAYLTNKKSILSIIEMIFKSQEKLVLLADETDISNNILIEKENLFKLNLDSKYNSIKWFINDLKRQKGINYFYTDDGSEDYLRFERKKNSSFNERIIYIDGGLGDHVLALPLVEKLKEEVFICCKYPQIFKHLKIKGFINWSDELFGGYSRFVYEYGSSNNSNTIVDAFFNMYGEKRTENDISKYTGDFTYNSEIPKDKKIVLICTSAAKINNQDSNKDWRDIRWFKLVHELRRQGNYVIQVGTKRDNQIPNVDMKFLDKPFDELAGLIDECSLWISVDTFFHHFAASIKPKVGICLTPFYNDHAKHKGVHYIERDCGKNFYERRWWLDLQQPERKECMDLIDVNLVLEKCKEII